MLRITGTIQVLEELLAAQHLTKEDGAGHTAIEPAAQANKRVNVS
jgi:hypothetical protein